MYAICSAVKGDVVNCVCAMVANKHHMPIMQFSAKTYRALEKDQSKVVAACNKVSSEVKYSINLNTRKIHSKDCKCKGKNVVNARLCSLKATGLIVCRKCLK